MNNNVKSFISREIESKPQNRSFIFIIILLINLVVFGYFGIIRGYFAYKDKAQIRSELQALEASLNRNITIINDLEPYVIDNTGALYVDLAIPDDPGLSDYLKDVTTLAGERGYTIRSFQFTGKEGSSDIPVSIQFIGSRYEFGGLLNSIENMDRLSSVDSISINSASKYYEGEDFINVNLKIYTYIEGDF